MSGTEQWVGSWHASCNEQSMSEGLNFRFQAGQDGDQWAYMSGSGHKLSGGGR
jgi:hypothetical protein